MRTENARNALKRLTPAERRQLLSESTSYCIEACKIMVEGHKAVTGLDLTDLIIRLSMLQRGIRHGFCDRIYY